jgi:hypothetical protein
MEKKIKKGVRTETNANCTGVQIMLVGGAGTGRKGAIAVPEYRCQLLLLLLLWS